MSAVMVSVVSSVCVSEDISLMSLGFAAVRSKLSADDLDASLALLQPGGIL